MTEITFKQRENSWVGETDALGKSVLQVHRKAKGSLFIYQFIPEMKPVLYKSIVDADANEVVTLEIVKGMKVQVVSSTEVIKCKMIGVNFIIAPEGTLMEDDIVNNLTTGGADKPLSAEQGKQLKSLVDAKVIPTDATTAKAGIVKKLNNVAKPAGTEAAQVKTTVDALIDQLISQGLMEGA